MDITPTPHRLCFLIEDDKKVSTTLDLAEHLVLKFDAPGNGEQVQAINNEIGNTLPKNTATNSVIENPKLFIGYI